MIQLADIGVCKSCGVIGQLGATEVRNGHCCECWEFGANSLAEEMREFLTRLSECMVTQPDGWEDTEIESMIRSLRDTLMMDTPEVQE